jgi:hypothetical protein
MKTQCCVWPNLYPHVDVIGTASCYMFGFMRPPVLHYEPIVTTAGFILRVGDRVSGACGARTSAGYFSLDMHKGRSLEFIGTYRTKSGKLDAPQLLCFTQVLDGRRIDPGWSERRIGERCYSTLYHGYQLLEHERNWFFATPSRAGRVVETVNVRLDETPKR